MEKPFWKIADENISFTETIISRLRRGEWYHPFFKEKFNWEWLATDENENGEEIIESYILDKETENISLNKFRQIVEENKDKLWDGWSRVIFDD